MSLRHVLCIIIVVACVMGGCQKKKGDKTADAEFADLPSLSEETDAAGSGDIFDEFYDDEKPAEKQPPASRSAPPPRPSSYAATEFAENGRYVVQISCVKSPAIGESNVSQLAAREYPAYLAEVRNPTPELIGTYYRVRIGSFHTVSQARAFGESVLQPEGYDFWVDNKSNDNVGIESYGLGDQSPASDYGSSSYGTGSAAPAAQSSGWETSSPAAPAASSDWESSAPAPAVVETPAQAPEPPPPASEPAADTPSTDEGDWGTDDWGESSSW